MLKKTTNILFSTRLMSMAILGFAMAMAIATFVEDHYDTATSKVLVYNTWWFELLMVILVINFIGNIFRYRLFRREKWPILLFHLSFVLILFGAFVTRYFGFEGKMLIREGEVSNQIISDKTFLNLRVDNGVDKTYHYNKSILFGQVGNPSYHLNKTFKDDRKSVPFDVKLDNFIPTTKERFVVDNDAPSFLHIVESNSGSRNDIFIKEKEVKSINGILFTYNNPIVGAMNFSKVKDSVYLKPVFDGTFMEMQSRKLTSIKKDSLSILQFLKLYKFNNFSFVVKEIANGKVITETAPKKERSGADDVLDFTITSGNESKKIRIKGAKYSIRKPSNISVNGLNFNISYGSKLIKTPFSVKLKDFQMERYPGTNSPSSYASEVQVLDKDTNFDFRIFMNHVLDYKGYRFFQSSFDPDEKGTHLSVNHDYWGTLLTYIGYFLMGLGMFFTLFWRGSRFKDITKKLQKIAEKKTLVFLLLLSFGFANAQQHNHEVSKPKTPKELQKMSVSKAHANKFGKLLIQDFGGRFKPVNTYALEALRKVYGKDTYKGLTAEQVVLSAQLMPGIWDKEFLIKLHTERLSSKLIKALKVKDGYASLNNFFPKRAYYLEDKVEESFRKSSVLRTYTDKEIINVDERVNIWSKLLSGRLMTMYPKKGDALNKWYAGIDREAFVKQDTMILKLHKIYMGYLYNAIKTNNYKEADTYLDYIASYQKKMGADIIPSDRKIDLEVKYNQWNIFKKLLIFYSILGLVLLVLAFIDLFKPKSKIIKIAFIIFIGLTILLAFAHVTGLGVRWYLSGHAPWSNGYEATVFIAFIMIVAGLIFSYNRSKFVIAVAVLFAGFLLGIAHGNLMSPEMTNLVPVLKSYWLMIHVAVITASYAFLGLGSLLGFIVLFLYILRTPKNAKRLNETIKELTYINESTLIVGLFLLSIGTFLGGVWANESWGRYWSWDPKEVWALISMMVYIFILHMRLVPGLQSRFTFNFISMISIATLIMTYFGVNYYLSGMHSYATGDPVPFPYWGKIAIVLIGVFSAISYWRYRVYKKLKKSIVKI